MPSPNLSWRTFSPGLYCWFFEFVGVGELAGVIGDDGAGVISRLLFCKGGVEDTLGAMEDVGRAGLWGVCLFTCGLPEPNMRPVSRDE